MLRCNAAAAEPREKKEPARGSPRAYNEFVAKSGAAKLPPGFPTGPWTTREEAKAEVASFCRNPATGHGAHGVVWGQLRPGTANHGPQSALLCHAHTPALGGCNWRVTLELFLEGWAPYSAFGDHSAHELAHNVAEANVHRAMRDIPADLLQTAKDMVSSGISVACADRFLRHQVTIRGEEPTWSYQDVYRATGATTRQRAMDATGFCELLFEREHNTGLFHRKQTDTDGCLSRAFFIMPDAEAIYAVDMEYNVVLLDTKARIVTPSAPRPALTPQLPPSSVAAL